MSRGPPQSRTEPEQEASDDQDNDCCTYLSRHRPSHRRHFLFLSMSGKSRHSASASTPSHGPKLPKFLQSKQTRDRSKSMIDPSSGSSGIASASSSSSNILSEPSTPASSSTQKNHGHRSLTRKGSKLAGVKERADQAPTPNAELTETMNSGDDSMDEPPVIIEPISSRPRTRSERPLSSASDNYSSMSFYQSSHSPSRITDLPTRLSGWFQHTFSSSSADLALPSLLSSNHLSTSTPSPKGKGSALLTAAKHGKDKAMRYLLDSDATPDNCPEVIWLLGVQHPGFELPSVAVPSTPPSSGRRGSTDLHHSPSFRSSTSSTVTSPDTSPDLSLSQSQPPSLKHPSHHWPPVFYSDFTSRIWLTYRSQFQPIRDSTLSALEREQGDAASVDMSSSPQPKRWNWPGTGEKGWTSDAGWGCMLRTGQSLLANALLHLHLGRDWRRPPYSLYTADYATYVRLLTWFFDSPSPYSPFSVHRMALAGKDLGKDVGQWFGPSTAAGAIKTLVHAFPEAGLGVSVAVDSQIFQTDVYSASHALSSSSNRGKATYWGDRAVLVLIGIRLGLDGVNPIYYDTIKASTLYTFPQSVGIAGGRPSSSYYFVGSQADNLFYLDPHHTRPAISLRPPPSDIEVQQSLSRNRFDRQITPESDREQKKHHGSSSHHYRSPTSPSSVRTGSSTFSYHAPYSPSPLAHQISSSSSSNAHTRWRSTSVSATPSNGGDSEFSSSELRVGSDSGLDPLQEHYINAYNVAELKTFHCDRVRKMPLSSLDPSMLIGFLCKDEDDWIDLRKRIADLSRNHKTIFSVHDEPPTWPSDSDDNMGLESMSEPDVDVDMPDDEGADGDDFFDASEEHAHASSVPSDADAQSGHGKAKSLQSEVDTEEDPVGPITPGPNSRSTFESERSVDGPGKASPIDNLETDDDDWVDPALPTPQPRSPLETPFSALSQAHTGSSNSKAENSGSKRNKKSKKVRRAYREAANPARTTTFPFPDEPVRRPRRSQACTSNEHGPCSRRWADTERWSSRGTDK
ncbi:hypothetical protein EW146_g8585 [Bondarzewia mesenterica]|uniref:Autophagy-related protein 4 n=1 Tax=Bondarzewia mesenterica TaxID=1095465 RepID=A0A4S4LD86_9AGAM|nr:hypothetical protein EW146_g8585 [Bondarzewia mesenterica]